MGSRDDNGGEQVGKKFFSAAEWKGFEFFMNPVNNNDGKLTGQEGPMCVLCHVADWTDPATLDNPVAVPDWTAGTDAAGLIPPVFTDFTYDNLGVPKNTEYPLGPDAPTDYGLGPVVGYPAENGKSKAMTLRNIEFTAPYAHNGLFKSLEEITHFCNTRDTEDWPAPEVPGTVNFDELGNLGLSTQDEAALVAFMKTLTDSQLK